MFGNIELEEPIVAGVKLLDHIINYSHFLSLGVKINDLRQSYITEFSLEKGLMSGVNYPVRARTG